MDQSASPSSQPKRFFDVMPPGQTTPATTSRPVIVGNKSEQPDPMMAPLAKAVPAAEPAPPGDDSSPEPAVTTETSIPVTEETLPPPPAEPAEPSAAETSPESALPLADESLGPAAPESLEPVKTPAAAPEPSAQASSSAVVVHHQSPRINLARIALFLLAILLLIAAIDVMFDAGVIKTTLPHTHFFTT